MLARRPTQPKNRWQGKQFASTCALLTTLLFSHASFAADARIDYDLDDDGLIEINDLADLDEIKNNLDGKTLYGSNAGCPDAQDGTVNGGCIGFELTTDLDFDTNQDGVMDANDDYWNNGEGWDPIGENNQEFSAIFNGNHYKINNLYIDRPDETFVGLFGKADNATIKNLHLTGSLTSVTGLQYVGLLVGQIRNNSNISYASVQGKVHAESSYAGGAIGEMAYDSILKGVSAFSQVSGNAFVGGIAGYLRENVTASALLSTGSVKGESYIAGIGGYISRGSSLTASYTTSNVLGGYAASAITGYTYNASFVQNHWALDTVDQQVGGIQYQGSGGPVTLSQLQCPIAANDTTCASVALFTNWESELNEQGDPIWDFGTAQNLPSLNLGIEILRDSDGDGVSDVNDEWPDNTAASLDDDSDGYPDAWFMGCDDSCRINSGLELDAMPQFSAAHLDSDLDGQPDAWNDTCDASCQTDSGLTIDIMPFDMDDDGISDLIDTNDGNDFNNDVDQDSDGLIEISTLEQFNAIRFQSDGSGLRMSEEGELDSSGCPVIVKDGRYARQCFGYELTTDLDFDTNGDGIIDENDPEYWNEGLGFEPIELFTGVFDGNFHEIKHLYIDRSIYSLTYTALFSSTRQATVKNFGLVDTSVIGNRHAASLIGSGYRTSLSQVYNRGSVVGTNYVGGIASSLQNGSIVDRVYSMGDVTGSTVGGIAAQVQWYSHVSNVFSSAIITSTVGLVGSLQWYSSLEDSLFVGFLRRSSNGNGLAGTFISSINQSYWAYDVSAKPQDSRGYELSELQCPVSVNDTSCAANTLYKNWDPSIWNFGASNEAPGLIINGTVHRDSDGDGVIDEDDAWIYNRAANKDADNDGYPDEWTLGCDAQCIVNSGLILDQFPEYAEAFQDEDLDGKPESWAATCDVNCQTASGLEFDDHPNDFDNDGQTNDVDTDDNNDGIPDVDLDSNGLIEVSSWSEFNAIRFQSNGSGYRKNSSADLNQSGCPVRLVSGLNKIQCIGYELTTDLNFDTNGNGEFDADDVYWNDGKGWQPFNSFSAVFDGNGHKIKNFNSHQSGYYASVFGRVGGATIKNLKLVGALTSVSGNANAGILAATAYNAVIENIYVQGDVEIASNFAGGVVGRIERSIIRNAIAVVSVKTTDDNFGYVGGITGRAYGNSTIENVMTSGDLSGGDYVGGITGYQEGQLNNAFSSAKVTARVTNGGAISGRCNTHVNFVLGVGRVNGVSNIGGLCGSGGSYSLGNYWSVDGTGLSYSAGNAVGRTQKELQCATAANDSGCSDIILYEGWDTSLNDEANPLWDFGSDEQLPGLNIMGEVYRDSDGDGALDQYDAFPLDADNDGVNDKYDDLPFNPDASLDADYDGMPDEWNSSCDAPCQTDSELTLDASLNDTDNDGINNDVDVFPAIPLNGLADFDQDGAPDDCDIACQELGMIADTDDDNDGVADVNDAYSLIALGERLDIDNDGIPNECDETCTALGMTADLDNDNDGVADANDAYPLISLGDRLDSDNDGIPNECDTACAELGMLVDTDDDNDGVVDVNDAYPLIAIGDLLDTDYDGAPNTCDTSCLELGMFADTDDDNDGVLDINDAYPLIAIGELLDTDNDGAPNTCDTECLELGMFADADNDNDGVLDINDAYPLISLGSLSDTDGDGIPNNCNTACLELGMLSDTDDDNDGVIDVNDAYPLITIGDLLDTDNDGAPNTCEVDCLALGMTADSDDDNDGVLDTNDAFPLIAIGNLLDTDNDGAPDTCEANCLALNMTADLDDDNDSVLDTADAFPLDNTEHSDFDNDGTGDVADLDDDNDGVNDVDDPNLGEDNGKPEIINVPSIEPVAVTTENGDAFELLVDDNFLNAFTTYDAVDTEFTYEASLNGNVLAIDENDIMLIPAGRQAVQVVAIDTSGNRSEPVEMVAIVYPQVRFEQATSIIGENSTTNIKVSLTGDAPHYPVVVNFAINELSDVNQADLDAGFDITAQHQVIIEAGDAEALNRDGLIEVNIIEDNESENDELLIVDLLSAKLESETDDAIESLFVIDETNMQHELTVTYQNLAPIVNLKLEQNGIEVANVQQDAGMVSITAIVQDGNGNDVHTLTWDLNNLGLNAPLGNTLNFSPSSLPVSTYEISVIATDNGVGQLSDDAVIRFDVVATETNNNDGRDGNGTQSSSGGSGGGSNSLWFMLLLFGLTRGLKINRRTH